ncbi:MULTISPECIES: pirin family protein [unclassified Legionella]|uniref:pirin family protein n=1 Tax=unclassified Legionella TaxID=2622702 RepID=UPI0010558314|nr:MULTISPECIES: pirin family protein [unclassified Legionella]MDI9818868.1 pirin family protein [Legionella sp. PL877]
MRTISQVHDATPFGTDKKNLRLFRVIGSTDIDGRGTQHTLSEVDPFIFLDDALIEGELPTSFNKHPHTGLTAVSYLLEGTANAWDNIHGVAPNLNHAGGVYCINAGKGIVHGEAPTEGTRRLRLLQLWFNPGIYTLPLPKASYQLFQPNEIPCYENERLWVKIIIGTSFKETSPVDSPWPIQYLHIKLAARQSHLFTIPDMSWQGFIYIIRGEGIFGKNDIKGLAQQCLIIGKEQTDVIQINNPNDTPLEFILATGQLHNKPFVKLLGHQGAIVAATEKQARNFMHEYEIDPENFGQS